MSGLLLRRRTLLGAAAPPPGFAADYSDWWADDLALSDGAAVSSWPAHTDDLGLGAHTQATGSKQPNYRASVAELGGRAAVQGDGVDDVLSSSTLGTALTLPATRIVVCVFPPEAGNNYLVGGSGTERFALLDANSNEWRTYAGKTVTSGVTLDTDGHLAVATFVTGTPDTLDLDGTQIASGDAGDNSLIRSDLFDLADLGGLGSRGHIAYHAIIEGIPTAQEVADLEAWASDYYGLVIA